MASPRSSLSPFAIPSTNAVIVFILLFLLYVNMCLNVSPSPTYMRSEPLVSRLKIEIASILRLNVLWVCLTVLICSNISLNCRFIPLNTRLNTLSVSVKANRNKDLLFFLLFISYLSIFEYYFIVFLPSEFWRTHLDTRRLCKKIVALGRAFHSIIASTILGAYYRTNHLRSVYLTYLCHYPLETSAIWIFLMR